jgi:hypothetical protein
MDAKKTENNKPQFRRKRPYKRKMKPLPCVINITYDVVITW